MIHGQNDAFVGDSGRRASFLSHIADSDTDMDGNSNLATFLEALSSCKKTIVCAISGHVCGGAGLEVIMSCDYRVTTSAVEFGGEQDPSMTMLSQSSSVSPWDASSKSQPINQSIMSRLLAGESVTSEEAKQIGLVDELVGADEVVKVSSLIAGKCGKRNQYMKQHQGTKKKLLYYLPDQFLVFRTSQLFNLIRDYPQSEPVLEELKLALSITPQYDYVISSIRSQLQDRLLIPGAHTEDVLQMYLRTYKVVSLLFANSGLRILDVFRKIANSVIDHLQNRPDSVKCIVSTLLEDSSTGTDDSTPSDEDLDVENVFDNIDDPDLEGLLTWTPPPLGAAASADDTMSLLIGVYGGKECFLSEYRDMLAARLVALGSFDIDREIASLDLMKSKFVLQPSDALTHCSVMIQDVVESRKLNLKIRNKLMTASSRLSMLVKSGHFWPNAGVPERDPEAGSGDSCLDQFTFLPPQIQALMKEFETIFTALKPTQKIEWRKAEGVVTLSIEIRGKETEFKLSPIYVEVVSLFQALRLPASAQPTPVPTSVVPAAVALSMEAIAEGAKESVDRIRPVVQFWVAKGVLREVEINKFIINE